MTSIEEKERRSRRRKRNFVAKSLEGPEFHERVVPDKSKREKRITVRNIEDYLENED